MDPIFDRLGRIIRSFGLDGSERDSGRSSDPLEREAEDELEEFLRTGKEAPRRPSTQGGRTYQEQRRKETTGMDAALLSAFAVFGLTSQANWDEVNTAHRALLKKHHPDRHAGNEALVKQSTIQSQKINEAFQVLKKHFGR